MIDLAVLIVLCTMFAYVIQSRTQFYSTAVNGIRKDFQSRLVHWGIIIAFILFAGLRSKYNDTSTYMHAFELISTNNLNLSTLLEPYGGFTLYQQLIKRYISENPQVFIFISSIITNILCIRFYTRHTNKYCGMIFIYAIGSFVFGMAGIKQAMSMAISLYAIENYLNKKYIKAIIILLLAMTFHPYIICVICIPLLKSRIWDRRTIIVIVICVIAFMNINIVFRVFNFIGQDYTSAFEEYTINPIRVLIEAVPIIISFIYRDKLNKNSDTILTLGVNMKIISFTFIVMGLFADPIYFGRMSTYFTVLSAITIPAMLNVVWKEKKNRKLYIWGYYIFFFLYFLMDMTKIGSISIFTDQFNHVSLGSLFL